MSYIDSINFISGYLTLIIPLEMRRSLFIFNFTGTGVSPILCLFVGVIYSEHCLLCFSTFFCFNVVVCLIHFIFIICCRQCYSCDTVKHGQVSHIITRTC